MTVVKVFHTQRDGSALHVANVTVPATEQTTTGQLEYAYSATQNCEGSWSQGETFEGTSEENLDFNPNIERIAPLHVEGGRTYGIRSSMMGDTFEIAGRVYTCAALGFTLGGKRVR